MLSIGINSSKTVGIDYSAGRSRGVADWWWILLATLPCLCVFGNVLVVFAVCKQKNLRTWTNYLLVSLAVADMLVACLVMPFAIYLTVNDLKWYLPSALCNFFCIADVSASTCSIVHLVAISVDRFYAIVMYTKYNSENQGRRIYGTIIFCWVFSFALGCPLGLGFNEGESVSADHCGIINPNFMLYTSIFAFFIPCLVMIVMYGFVFHKLGRRMRSVRLQEMAAARMVNFGEHLGSLIQDAVGKDGMKRGTVLWAMPFVKSLEETVVQGDSDDLSEKDLQELTTILNKLSCDQRDEYSENDQSVLFLLCYLPFFSLNIIKVIKLKNESWTDDLERMFMFFTWLGYLNSCLNPVIYSLFNRRFREAFKNLLCCLCMRFEKKSAKTMKKKPPSARRVLSLKFKSFVENETNQENMSEQRRESFFGSKINEIRSNPSFHLLETEDSLFFGDSVGLINNKNFTILDDLVEKSEFMTSRDHIKKSISRQSHLANGSNVLDDELFENGREKVVRFQTFCPSESRITFDNLRDQIL